MSCISLPTRLILFMIIIIITIIVTDRRYRYPSSVLFWLNFFLSQFLLYKYIPYFFSLIRFLSCFISSPMQSTPTHLNMANMSVPQRSLET